MIIRRFEEKDAGSVSDMIALTLRVTNSRDYTDEYIDRLITHMRPGDMIKNAGERHFYVAELGGAIIGCGAIGMLPDKADESCFYTVFVHPGHQGEGVGRKIVETLESDVFFLKSVRAEVPASITALPFYLKLGYRYKPGVTGPDEEGLIRLEKLRA